MEDKLLVLAIDDEHAALPSLPARFDLEVIDPTGDDDAEFSKQLTAHVGSASVILIDHKFRDETPSLSMKAQDGASFVAHLRSWARTRRVKLAPLVMFTNQEDAFANEIPAVGASVPLGGSFRGREHRLAPTLDVEWIAFKDEKDIANRISSLALSYEEVRKASGSNGVSLGEIEGLLRIPAGAIWTERAKEELQSARPPVNEMDPSAQESVRGSAQVIRWLCQRALSYPGMLMSDLFAAWSLGLTVHGFRALANAEAKTAWLEGLHQCRYQGLLHDFLGRRWWRAGIGQLVWQLEEVSARSATRESALAEVAPGIKVGPLVPISTHAVAWTDDFREDSIRPVDQLVQLHPPGWPAEAMEPWLPRSEIERDRTLRAMCDPSDLEEN
ncbi:hypothetical protein ACVW1C_005830 [Bradyrhizobium sp. USDA 4011]